MEENVKNTRDALVVCPNCNSSFYIDLPPEEKTKQITCPICAKEVEVRRVSDETSIS